MFVDLDCGHRLPVLRFVGYYFVPVAMHVDDPSSNYKYRSGMQEGIVVQ
jgi:hypothetical protein